MRRLLLLAFLGAGSVPAQLGLFVVQGDSEAPINGQYSFGTVSMGDVRDIPFRLRNTGNSTTPLTVLSLTGVDFAFVNPPAVSQNVAGGAAVDFTVRYAPTAPSSSATFTADGVSAILFGSALAASTVSLDDGGDAPDPDGGRGHRLRQRRARFDHRAAHCRGQLFDQRQDFDP